MFFRFRPQVACRTCVIVLRFAGERESEREARDERGAQVTRVQPVAGDSRPALTSARLKAQKNCACSSDYRAVASAQATFVAETKCFLKSSEPFFASRKWKRKI